MSNTKKTESFKYRFYYLDFGLLQTQIKIPAGDGEEDGEGGEEDDNAEAIELFYRVRDFNERDAGFGFCTEL